MGGGEAGLGQAQSRVLAKLWLAEPQSACLEAVYALKLPLVRKSRRVYTVSSAPPPLRMRQVSRHNVPFQSPVDTYTARPASLHVYKRVTRGKNTPSGFVDDDDEAPDIGALVRFSDYHLQHNTEAFFYNVLLANVSPLPQNTGAIHGLVMSEAHDTARSTLTT